MAPAKMGRPARSGSSAASIKLSIRLTPDELAAWTKAAGDSPVSEWARRILNSVVDIRPTKL